MGIDVVPHADMVGPPSSAGSVGVGAASDRAEDARPRPVDPHRLPWHFVRVMGPGQDGMPRPNGHRQSHSDGTSGDPRWRAASDEGGVDHGGGKKVDRRKCQSPEPRDILGRRRTRSPSVVESMCEALALLSTHRMKKDWSNVRMSTSGMIDDMKQLPGEGAMARQQQRGRTPRRGPTNSDPRMRKGAAPRRLR